MVQRSMVVRSVWLRTDQAAAEEVTAEVGLDQGAVPDQGHEAEVIHEAGAGPEAAVELEVGQGRGQRKDPGQGHIQTKDHDQSPDLSHLSKPQKLRTRVRTLSMCPGHPYFTNICRIHISHLSYHQHHSVVFITYLNISTSYLRFYCHYANNFINCLLIIISWTD